MAKNTFILAELKADDPFNIEQREIKGELKVDKIRIEEYAMLDDMEDEYENWLSMDDVSIVAAFELMWEDWLSETDWQICHIYGLSTNSATQADSVEKRAEQIRKYLKNRYE